MSARWLERLGHLPAAWVDRAAEERQLSFLARPKPASPLPAPFQPWHSIATNDRQGAGSGLAASRVGEKVADVPIGGARVPHGVQMRMRAQAKSWPQVDFQSHVIVRAVPLH